MNEMLLAALAVAVALGLGGCDSDSDKAREQGAQCLSWGAKQGTDTYVTCRAMLAHNTYVDDDKDNAALAGMAIGMAAGSSNSGSRK